MLAGQCVSHAPPHEHATDIDIRCTRFYRHTQLRASSGVRPVKFCGVAHVMVRSEPNDKSGMHSIAQRLIMGGDSGYKAYYGI